MDKKLMINGCTIEHNGYFAYDACHKIYILRNKSEEEEAKSLDYQILPIGQLELAWDRSCPLRFICYWSLEPIVRQSEEADIKVGQ